MNLSMSLTNEPEPLRAIWEQMRDPLRADGYHVLDGDGSPRAIAEAAGALATVMLTEQTARGRPDPVQLATAGALATLATAARLVDAAEARDVEAAHRAASLALDLFTAAAEARTSSR